MSLVSYQSILPINASNPLAGLRLLKESIKRDTNFTNGITICNRFNYRQLGADKIWSPKTGIGSYIYAQTNRGFHSESESVIKLNAAYDKTFFWFGKMNWILRDMVKDSFLAWSTNRWHGLCVSYDRKTSHITLVKVSF